MDIMSKTTTTRGNLEIFTGKIGKYIVNLTRRAGKHFHSFEVYTDKTTNESGYYAEGCLEIEGDLVTGYDGTYELPLAVALALEEEGYGFAPYVFPTSRIKKFLDHEHQATQEKEEATR